MLQCDKELVLADVTDQVTWAAPAALQHTIRGGMQPAAVLGNTAADHRTPDMLAIFDQWRVQGNTCTFSV